MALAPLLDLSAMMRLSTITAFAAVLLGSPARPGAQERAVAAPRPVVYVVPVTGMIDLGLAPFVQRSLEEAARAGAAAVVLDVDTFGGRVDAAVQIRDGLLRSRLRTVAFVDKRAISAGALISLAAQTILMAEGGTLGAATPVQIGGPGQAPQPVAEKTVSYMRKEFRATAEARGRPPLLAEAMVDADVEVPGVVDKGKLLTLTTEEAVQQRVADGRADDLDAVLRSLGLAGAEVRRTREAWAESLVRFLTHPVVSSLLMTVGILGLIVELRTPGLGLPGAVGAASLGLFFWGHWLVRLAGWEELLLVGLGLVLLAVELLVTPGFGVPGIAGILALVAGLGLSLTGEGATWGAITAVFGRVLVSLLLAGAGAVVMIWLLPYLPVGRPLVLESSLRSVEGFAADAAAERPALGSRGTTLTPLRPAGLAGLGDRRVDVVSDGAFVEAGQPVEVIRVDGNRVVVRQVPGPAAEERV